MRILILLCYCILSAPFIAAGSDGQIDRIFELTGAQKFVNSIKKIKTFNSIEEIDETQYELQKFYGNLVFWRAFDEEDFRESLKKKMKIAFSNQELGKIEALFSKPFLAKLLNTMVFERDIFLFRENLLSSEFEPGVLVKDRFDIVKKLYLVHGLKIQDEKVKAVLSLYTDLKLKKVELKNKKTDRRFFSTPEALKFRLEKSEDFLVRLLGSDLKSFSHYELREYLRVMKGATVQVFLQLYTNYHFLYMMNFLSEFELPKK